MLSVLQTKRVDDKTGRVIITYTPQLKATCTATGTLSFASWEVWADDPPEAGLEVK